MAIKKATGLRGLQGIRRWDALSEKEKEDYLKKYPSLRGRSVADVSKIYDNTNYVNEFGKEDFLSHPDKAERDARLKHTVVERAKDKLLANGYESLSDDENRALMGTIAGLTDDGFIELAEDEDFMFPSEIQKLEENERKRKELKEENPAKSILFDFITGQSLVSPKVPEAKYGGKSLSQVLGAVEDIHKVNQEKVDAVVARDTDRKQSAAAPLATQYRQYFDQMPAEEFEEEFSKVFEGQEVRTGYGNNEVDYKTPGIGLYKEFKNQDEMANFSTSDKKKMLANYFAVAQLYGPQVAEQTTTTALQNYIHGNQDAWDWIGSAARGIGGKFTASFGQLGLGIQVLGNTLIRAGRDGWDEADKWVANFMQGKDAEGNDRKPFDNLVYWNGVDQLGVLPGWDDVFGEGSYSEIQRINENGGISHYNWLAPAGAERNLSSALNEGLKMIGYMTAQALVGKGVGAIGKAATRGVGGAFSEVTGLYNAAWSSPAANIIMKYATPGLVSVLNAIPISVGYAKGSFDEVLRETTDRADYEAERWAAGEFEKLDDRIQLGIALTKNGFSVSEDSENPQESAQIANEMNQWVVNKYNDLINQGVKPENIDVARLYNDALGNYKDYRRQQYINEYKNSQLYKDMIDAARKEAASAYERNATIEFLRMCGVNYLYRQWQQDKSVQAAMSANYPNLSAVDRNGQLVTTGKIFGVEVSPKMARYVQPLKSLWGGFESNYMDDVTAAYSKGFSLGRYNNYVDQLLDPEKEGATISWMAGFTNALAKAETMLSDPQAWYDGFIGALGTGEYFLPGTAVRSLATKQGRSSWRAKFNYSQTQLAQMASQYGLSIEEYLNDEFEKYVERVHPNFTEEQVQSKVNEIRAKDGLKAAVADGRIERVSFGEKVNSIIYNPLLDQYRQSVERERDFKAIVDGGNKAIAEKKQAIEDMIRVVYASNRKAVSNKTDDIFEGKEAKALQAFTLVSMMSRWAQDPILSKSEFVKDSWAKVERFAKGKVEDADIEDFYSSVENKSEQERPDAADFAKQRLISNAKQLIKMRESYEKAQKKTKDSKQFRVIAHHRAVDYVTEQLAYNQAMLDNRNERKRQIRSDLKLPSDVQYSNSLALYGSEQTAQDAIVRIDKQISEIDKEIKSIDEKGNRKDKNATRTIRKLRAESSLLHRQELERQKSELIAKKRNLYDAIESKQFDKVLSKEEILSLTAEGLATMLDSKNAKLYSKEQKAQIEEAKRELKSRDPNALDKVRDLAELEKVIEDTWKSDEIMRDNLEAAADYFEYAEKLRAERLEGALIDHHYRQAEKAIAEAPKDDDKIAIAKTLSVQSLDRYLENHPEYTELLKGVKELAKLSDDIRESLKDSAAEEQEKIKDRVREDGKVDTDEDVAAKEEEQRLVGSMAQAIEEEIFGRTGNDGRFEPGIIFHSSIKNEQDLMGVLEELADRNTDPKIKALYNNLLRNLEELSHERNATVIQSRKEREAKKQKQEEFVRKQDGKNFGWDGYKVGDTVYHKDGRKGEVQGFIQAKEGESSGAIKVWWIGDKPGSTVIYTDKSVISKTAPVNTNTVKATTEKAHKAVEALGNADTNIDKLDAVVAFELAIQQGAEVSEVERNAMEQAKKELAADGIDYKMYLQKSPTNEAEEEILAEEGDSWTPDGGLITPTEEEEYENALGETEGDAVEIPDAGVRDTGSDKERNSKNYRADEGLLEGNGLYEYSVDALKDLGVVERRVPYANDSYLGKFFQWLDKEHIQLQEIVDRVLSRVYQKLPDTKIQFMISNDPLTSQQVLQVVEVTDKIEAIYNKANKEVEGDLGGIVVATDGDEEKRYLIVGTTYSHIGMGFYNIIGNPLKTYIENHPSTKYYVHPNISSKIAKIDFGRYVRQQKGETEIKYRTLSELFADSSRNPYGLSFEDAVFGIMYKNKGFVPNRAVSKPLFPPGKRDASLGRVFLMIPAADGSLVPVALKTDVSLNSPELKKGELTDRIEMLLRKATSRTLEERKDAIRILGSIIKFDSEGGKITNGILVGSKDINNLTLVLNGSEVKHWNLDDAKFDAMDFINTVMQSPFRIRITQRMLSPENIETLKTLDEAGVLRTDISSLHTVNVAYQIYPVDGTGKIIEKKVNKAAPNPYKTSPSKAASATDINGHSYRLVQGDYVDEFGNRVEDKALRVSIHYNLYIQRSGLQPSFRSGQTGLSYYVIVNNEDNPTIVSMDKGHNIQVLSKDRAIKLLSTINEQNEINNRVRAAEEELKRIREGKEGIVGEEMPESDTPEGPAKPESPEEPVAKKLTFIEPKHSDNVTFGPAIDQKTIFVKGDGDVEMELHTEVTVKEDGSKLTRIVGWDTKGNNWIIPWRYSDHLLDIPDGYRLPDDIGNVVNIRSIEETPDGKVWAEAKIGTPSDFTVRTVELQSTTASEPPVLQEPAKKETSEKPKSNYDPNKASRKSLKELGSEKKTTTFVSMYGKYRTVLNDIAKEKGWDWGKTTKDKEEFLKKKLGPGFDPNMITDVDTLIDNIRSCK